MSVALREARLTAIRFAGEAVNSYEFVPLDGQGAAHLGPGTHVDLEVQEGVVRQYSLAALRNDCYVIGVQRDRASRGASSYLHDRARVGDRFRIGSPRNLFGLDESASHSVLIAGGIGITPMLTMADRLAELGAPWTLHYAWRSGEIAFERELRRHGDHVVMAVRDAPGYRRLEIDRIVAEAPVGATFYCCGPAPMVAGFELASAGLAPDRVHIERFAAQEPLAVDGGFTVVLQRTGRELLVVPGRTILEALLDAGIDAPYSCQQGICGACETAVLDGVPDHRDGILSPAERASGKTMMICCSGSRTARLVLDR